jgi:hypothetical protein
MRFREKTFATSRALYAVQFKSKLIDGQSEHGWIDIDGSIVVEQNLYGETLDESVNRNVLTKALES